MTPEDPQEREHRVPSALRGVVISMLPSLLAVMAVSAVLTALYVWQSEQDTSQTLDRTPIAAPPAATGAATAKSAAAPAPSVTATPSSSVTATPTPAASSPRTTTSVQASARLSVVVLNQTARIGLARRVAQRLRAQKWTVAQIGNFRGQVASTTVYYPAGAKNQADALARSLPTPPRTRPVFGNLSKTRLTVVLANNYPRQR